MKPSPCPGRGSTLLCVSLSLSLLLLTGNVTSAQVTSKANRASAESVTQSLMALNAQYQTAPPAGKAALLPQFRSVAAQRQQLLSSLVQTSPGEVLRVAIPGDVAATLPASIQGFVEQETDAQGELEVMYEDSDSGAKLHHFLTTGGQRLELKFAADAPTNLLTGATVHVHGTRIGSALALSSGTSTSSFQVVQAAPLSNTFGAQHTLVILVNFQDNASQPWTAQAAQSMVFSTASNFWLENSFQQTWLTGDVAGWFTLPMTSGTCDISSIQSYGQQAAQNAGYVLANYSHFLYTFPQISACGWGGYSYIGGNPTGSWINGSLYQEVVSHELGHALGLYHSHSLDCRPSVYAASGCTQYEYGDYYDTMGNSSVNGFSMDYNTFQKERLGWLNNSAQPPITTVTSSGSYQIGPYETQDSTAKALKILQSSSSGSYYYVEFRQALGFDNFLSNCNIPGNCQVANGVLVHVASPGTANSSHLLDMNPGGSWGTAMALDVGQSYTDSAAGVTISPTSVSSSGATVQVTLAGGTCAPANPTVSLSPSQSQWVPAGMAVTFTATVVDNDSPACGGASFNLADSLPSGWSGLWNTSSVALTPGTSGSTTLQVTSPTGAANGFYNLGVSATNAAAPSYTASAAATYVVSNPQTISISVSANPSTASPGQTVLVNVTVDSGSSPDAGASITVTVTPPGGGRTKGISGTTGSNGVASFSYNLNKHAAKGTYQVQASTPLPGNSPAQTASTTFTVQ
jgi:NPCBM-associated, NEW3 domain of alpha-galactosidase/Gametolysin peptidase M11